MRVAKKIIENLSAKERKVFFALSVVLAFSIAAYAGIAFVERTEIVPFHGGSWREGVLGHPEIVNPVFGKTQADADVSALLFESLPKLMTAHREEEGGRVHVVTLAEGLMWSDGKPFTADDVVFTVARIQDPESNSPLLSDWQGVRAERLSELQVRFILPIDYAFFLENLSRLRPIPRHVFEGLSGDALAFSPYAREPVGSGPYRVKRVAESDGKITRYDLTPNAYWAGGKPYISRFSLSFFETQEELESAYRLRSLDGFGTAGKLIDNDPRGTLETVPMGRYYAVFFNLRGKNAAVRNKDIRLALDRAAPKQRIIDEALDGRGTLINSPVLRPGVPAENRENRETASELISKAGVKNLSFTLTVPKNVFLEKTAEMLKASWESVGAGEITIDVRDAKDIFENSLKTGEYDAVLFGNILENPDDLYPFWHSSARDYPGQNISGFANANADTLLENLRATDDAATRSAELDSLALYIGNETPAVFLYAMPYSYVRESRLRGFAPKTPMIGNPADRFSNVGDWYVEHGRIFK
jgi:peptide/nickel transport system substrate-binding protein